MNIIKTTKLSLSLLLILTITSCTIMAKPPVISKSSEKNNAFISGSVVDGDYIAMDKSFSIKIPFKKGSREYDLMEIDEFYHEKGASIVFGELNKKNNIYNLEIIKVNNKISFEEKSNKLLSQYKNDLMRNYHSIPKVLKKYKFKIHGYNTIHWNLLQKVGLGNNVSGLNYGLVNHQIFAINLDKKIVFIWVQKTADKANKHNNLVTAYDFATSLSFPGKVVDMNLLTSLQ